MKSLSVLIILIAVTIQGISYSGGIEKLPVTSSKTVSLNSLYFAGSDGIVKSFSNPAGLIYLDESSLEFSINDRLAQSEFDNPSRGLFKSFREDEFNFNGGLNWSISDRLNAALLYLHAIDYKVSWPYANLFREDSLSALLAFDFYNTINVEVFSTAFAYRMDNIILGLSPTIYRITNKMTFPQNNPLWTSGIGTAAYQFEYDLNAWSFGINAGLIAEFFPELRIAVSARSGFSADMKGDARSRMLFVTDSTEESTKVKSTFEMPWIFSFGALYTISPNVNMNFDLQYSLWGNTSKVATFDFDNQIWQNRLNQTDITSGINGSRFTLEYKNSLDIGAGIEYKTRSNVSYRLGYLFTQTPNTDTTYNMLYPGVDRHTISIGAGLREGNLIFDASLIYSFGIRKDITYVAIPNLTGSYNYNMVMPMITLKYLL